MKIKYSNGLHDGGRLPALWLAKGEVAVKFDGQLVPGFVRDLKVIARENVGKWSSTTWELALEDGVEAAVFLREMWNEWGSHLTSWAEAAKYLAVSEPAARVLVRAAHPKVAARLDRVAAFPTERVYAWRDGPLPGGRRPRLWFVRGDLEGWKFEGQDIPGVAIVAGATFTQNGKWSHTDWTLHLGAGVQPVCIVRELHEPFAADCEDWVEAAAKLKVGESLARRIVGVEYPESAKALDIEEKCRAEGGVVLQFPPTEKAIDEGRWRWPDIGVTPWGEDVTVRPHPQEGWREPIIAPPRAYISRKWHVPGYEGGTQYVRVCVPRPT